LLCSQFVDSIRYSFRLDVESPPSWSKIEANSAPKAFTEFLQDNGLSGSVAKAKQYFGLQSKKLQNILSDRMSEEPEVASPIPKRRGPAKHTTLKALVKDVVAQPKDSEVRSLRDLSHCPFN
jgi:hypothetical protein